MQMSARLFPIFSSVRFSVSGLMLRSLIHLKLSFVQDVKYGPIFIILYAALQFDQHHLFSVLQYLWLLYKISSILMLRCVSGMQQKDGSCFLIHYFSLCLLIETTDVESYL